jgi:hypothetical protein
MTLATALRIANLQQSDIRAMTRACDAVGGINLGQGLGDLLAPGFRDCAGASGGCNRPRARHLLHLRASAAAIRRGQWIGIGTRLPREAAKRLRSFQAVSL